MKHDTYVEERYFLYLCREVGIDSERPASQEMLLAKQLHQTPFVWLMPNDVNRVEDALDFRFDFAARHIVDPDNDWMTIDASVLEILVSLALRCAYLTDQPTSDWFMIFLDNLGLIDASEEQVDDIISCWLYRKYDKRGVGGLFPLRSTKKDQRKVELWSQMSAYLNEELETLGFFDWD